MIRQNPENPCLIESSIDGVHWCAFIDLSKCSSFGTQPGPQPAPQPGGGAKQYCFNLRANETVLLPALVSTGDTVSLDRADGAGYDGGEFDLGPLWRCPDGAAFVGGLCTGFYSTKPGDPLPSEHHMALIIGYGATPDYLLVPLNTPVTIPSGVSQAKVWLQVNDDPIGNNQGSYDVCVTVTNNNAALVHIPVTSSAGVYTPFATELGSAYTLSFSGTAHIHNTPPINDTDAFYWTNDGWATHARHSGDFGLSIDGTPLDSLTVPYNASHEYAISFTGTGAPVLFQYRDTEYSDNEGELLVSISLT